MNDDDDPRNGGALIGAIGFLLVIGVPLVGAAVVVVRAVSG